MAEVSEHDRIRLVLEVEPDVDPTELDLITTELRDRVLEVVEVHHADRIPDQARERDLKAGEAFLPGQLEIVVPLAAVAIHEVFSTIRTYIRERPVVSVKIRRHRKGHLSDLEITGTTGDVEALARRCLDGQGGQAPGAQEHERGD